MKVKSIISVHVLAFGLGLTCANGYGMNNPMDNRYTSPENNSANMPMESVNIQEGFVGSNSNIDYDSLSKDDLLRMFLRLEEQNRQQTQMLMAQNEEYKRRIESLEASSDERRRHNTVMENLARQQSSAAAAREREQEAARKRERQAERDGIRQRINSLREERNREERISREPIPDRVSRWEYDEVMKKRRAKREAVARIPQIDAEISALNVRLASLQEPKPSFGWMY